MTLSKDTQAWCKETADRLIKSFAQGYLASWLISGRTFDTLFTVDNLKAGVVLVALSLATAAGLKQLGTDQSTSRLL
jgi:hypothetical protein